MSIPKCSECGCRMGRITLKYPDKIAHTCNLTGEITGYKMPKTSPKWCPKRT